MVEEREIITVLLSVLAIVMAVQNRRSITDLPRFRMLLASAAVLWLGTLLSVLEGLIWEDRLNVLEHVAYGISSLLLAVWAWMARARSRAAPRGRAPSR